jgi:putative transposase
MKKFQTESTLGIVKRFLVGEGGVKLLARRWSLPEVRIRSWVSHYRLHGVDGFRSKRSAYRAQFKLQVLWPCPRISNRSVTERPGMMSAPSGQEHVVKKSTFTEEPIAFALKQAELGTRLEEVCRQMGISEATFYLWKTRYGGVGPPELRRLRQLQEENRKLKLIVADLSLDKAMLQAVVAKKL